MRETDVPCGVITNGKLIRLVYAPKGETSGYITFSVEQMLTVAGRPIFAALFMLMCEERMFSVEQNKRLPAILLNSRKYQNLVSTQLAEQVMSALFELLRGFQAADDQRGGDLLREILANEPQHVYHGLLTVLMRMVFILYAEDRGLISTDPVYTNHYSITGLFDRLRSDDGRFPDTMDQRYGAWGQLLTLFRLIYDGGQHGSKKANFKIPPRDGYLFNPNRYPFLEGRYDDQDVDVYSDPERQSPINVPRVSDGVIFRVLNSLLMLDGERLSYRALDVEQIGSVYEAIMGFELEVAGGRSIAIKPVKKHGAPATINLEALLEAKAADRSKRLKEWADQKLTGAALKELKDADSIEGLLSALDKKVAKTVTPNIVPKGAMVFQPSDERRRSGSHYTPRSLTEPIVRTTLEPILKQLLVVSDELLEKRSRLEEEVAQVKEKLASAKRDNPKLRTKHKQLTAKLQQTEKDIARRTAAAEAKIPHPTQLLQLKICDPAMGSGAFLVEVCRQLADELLKSWAFHAPRDEALRVSLPELSTTNYELPTTTARRLVAQRCLYGVDKNVMAVDLAKLSLWLVTLARDHAFTFLDHSLQHGDSLVGLTREQIIGFHWDPKKFKTLLNEPLQRRLDRATEARAKILNAREDVPYKDQEQRLAVADDALDLIRTLGDACVSSFFAEPKKKAREEEVGRVFGLASSYMESLKQPQVDHASRAGLQEAAARLRDSSQENPVPAFHWEIEFPEVFSREDGGFDAFVGNPPFLGGTRVSTEFGMGYFDWLKSAFPPAGHLCDLVAHFFRRTFDLLRTTGCYGLIATKTISQGDTREGGLRIILKSGGTVYAARRNSRWPGAAAVIVSHVFIKKGAFDELPHLDGKPVKRISAYLVEGTLDESPHRLKENPYFSAGSKIYGQGFLFDEGDEQASPLSLMEDIRSRHPECSKRIFPYIGGEEVNSDPTHKPHRHVIYLSDLQEERELNQFEPLRDIVHEKVRPGRMVLGDNPNNRPLKKRWWAYQAHRPDLYDLIRGRKSVVVISQVTAHFVFAFVPASYIYAHTLNVFDIESVGVFAAVQSRAHEIWTRFFASSLEDRLRYTPSDCFATFPFPNDSNSLQEAGNSYLACRSSVMKESELGLTKTYNRFHSPDERDEGILELRRLHGLMDGAVLRAYGWDDLSDLASKSDFCQFLLDYEEEENEDSISTQKKSRKKKPWRYRWPDDFRDEVLSRLLELNEKRHEEELLAGCKPKLTNQTRSESDKSKNQSQLF